MSTDFVHMEAGRARRSTARPAISPHRARWAAIGAAIAVTVGSGGLLTASASVGSGNRAVFVPITPCRIVDTRPGTDQVGPRSAPLGPGEAFTQQVVGTNGNCTIPADAIAVSLNVTAVGGTAGSYFTVYPADAARPLSANLNWVANAAPTPNKVDVGLSASGAFKVYNFAGQVNLVADVTGYYADHVHDDRYYTKAQTDTAISVSVGASVQEVVQVVNGAAFTPPAPMITLGSSTFTTTKTGRLHISLDVMGGLGCTTNSVYNAWLVLDGVALGTTHRSMFELPPGGFDSAGFPPFTVEGVTPAAVAAGAHTIAVGAACPTGDTLTASSESALASGVVTVLP